MVRGFSHSPELYEDVALEEEVASGWCIILYNDDVNTFEWVIECLVKYCGHESMQAEQCAWIVHTKGKCMVKSGDFKKLEPICTALCDHGLSAELEENK
jgi:ATP-dependent Clp protease adaptor protein ClpS